MRTEIVQRGRARSRRSAVGPEFVLLVDWFVRLRNTKPFATALQRAFNTLYFEAIKDRLRENKQSRRFPSTWSDYTEALATGVNGDLKADPSKTYLKRSGLQEVRIRELLPTPLVVESPLDVLMPDLRSVLTRATQHLCRSEVSVEDARVFTDYCLTLYERHRHNRRQLRQLEIDPIEISAVARREKIRESDAEDVILRVLRTIANRVENL